MPLLKDMLSFRIMWNTRHLVNFEFYEVGVAPARVGLTQHTHPYARAFFFACAKHDSAKHDSPKVSMIFSGKLALFSLQQDYGSY